MALNALIEEDLFHPENIDCNSFTLLDYEVFYLQEPNNCKPKSFDVLVKHTKKYEISQAYTLSVYANNPELVNHPSVQSCVKSLIRHKVDTDNSLIYLLNNNVELLNKLQAEVASESRELSDCQKYTNNTHTF